MMDCRNLATQAHAAGMAALHAAEPTPMVVVGAGASYVVTDGVCGFAWVTCKGNTKFGRWAKASVVAAAVAGLQLTPKAKSRGGEGARAQTREEETSNKKQKRT